MNDTSASASGDGTATQNGSATSTDGSSTTTDPAAAAAAAAAAANGNGAAAAAINAEAALDPALFEGGYKELLERKQYGTVGDALTAIQNLEKLVGGDTVKAPVGGETQAFFKENAERLQVPAAADGYTVPKIELPEGMDWDQGFEDAARAFAHERSIPNDIFGEFVSFVAQQRIAGAEAAKDKAAAADADAMAALRKQWPGSQFEAKLDIARQGAKALGVPAEVQDMLDAKMGTAAVMEHFYMLGQMMSEGNLLLGDDVGFGNEAADARQQIAELKGDSAFTQKLRNRNHVGHKEALDKWNRLHRIAGGEAPTD